MKIRTRWHYVMLFAAFPAILNPPIGRAQPDGGSLDDASRKAVIDRIAVLLDENYVFQDVGKQCGAHLQRQFDAGRFTSISDRGEFAAALTRELQSVSKDKHMRVGVRPLTSPADGEPENPILRQQRMNRRRAESNYGIPKVEILAGNIGYCEITGFPPRELTRETAVAAMKFLRNADALIIDLRRNGGGNPTSIQLISSYFFDTPTHLNSLYWRKGDRTEEFWTDDSVDGTRLADVPIFVLTSKRTFSGGEEFANNLKTRKRALLIGETTGGGANPGGQFPLPASMSIFVPTGRAINPVTGTNWEGVGVIPDIQAESDRALDVALEMAKTAAEKHRAAGEERTARRAQELHAKLSAAAEMIAAGNSAAATTQVDATLQDACASGLLDESLVNALGYEFLTQKRNPDMAVAIFEFNVRRYPESSNVYDSLGEAFMERGEKGKAIQNYQRSLELDPSNTNARAMIERLQTQ